MIAAAAPLWSVGVERLSSLQSSVEYQDGRSRSASESRASFPQNARSRPERQGWSPAVAYKRPGRGARPEVNAFTREPPSAVGQFARLAAYLDVRRPARPVADYLAVGVTIEQARR